MRHLRRVALAAVCALASGGAAGFADEFEPASAVAVENAVPAGVDVLYLAQNRPLILRFVVTANGQPLMTSLSELVDHVFPLLDQNGDGTLDRAERQRIPSRRTLQGLGLIAGTSASTTLLQSDVRSQVASRGDLQQYLEKLGLHVFRLTHATSAPANPNVVVVGSPGDVTTSPMQAVGEKLFAQVDADNNAALTSDELANVEGVLRRVDLDLDEVYSVQEFLLLDDGSRALHRPIANRNASIGTSRFHLLTGQSPARLHAVAQACASYYGHPAETPRYSAELFRRQTHLTEEAFQRIDRAGDDVIDVNDWIACFASTRPDIVVRQWFGKAASSMLTTERFQAQDLSQIGLGPQLPIAGGGQDLDIVSDRLQLRFIDYQKSRPSEDFLKIQFVSLDRDKNDYIDRNEAGRLRAVDFRELDRDANGMVFFDEFATGTAPTYALADQLVELAVDAGGFDLFAATDVNKDSRLSIREVRTLPKLLEQWDRNRDGTIDENELPRYFTLRLGYGMTTEGLVSTPQNASFLSPSQPRTVTTENPPGSPWFSQMDRNADGDVSRREFLGKLVLFDRWDTDHDGLLSPSEAAAADPNSKESKAQWPFSNFFRGTPSQSR